MVLCFGTGAAVVVAFEALFGTSVTTAVEASFARPRYDVPFLDVLSTIYNRDQANPAEINKRTLSTFFHQIAAG